MALSGVVPVGEVFLNIREERNFISMATTTDNNYNVGMVRSIASRIFSEANSLFNAYQSGSAELTEGELDTVSSIVGEIEYCESRLSAIIEPLGDDSVHNALLQQAITRLGEVTSVKGWLRGLLN